MTICLADLHRNASPQTRRLLRKLAQQGVTYAGGCVITSAAGMGAPPAGHDHVLFRAGNGCLPLGEIERTQVQSVMAHELTAVVTEMLAAECETAWVVEANYVVQPMVGIVSLNVLIHGLVDRATRV